MMELFAIYQTTIAAGAVMAGALALLGMQLAARDKAMQTVCVGQGASVGVIVGLAVIGVLHSSQFALPLIPFGFGISGSVLTVWLTDRLVARKLSSKNTVFAAAFSVLVAIGHLIGSLLPGLENHLTQIYFGDLATLSDGHSKVALGVGVAVTVYLAIGIRAVTLNSFDAYWVGEKRVLSRGGWMVKCFPTVSVVLICLSVQALGFLFTIACLFLPTAILANAPAGGLKHHARRCFVTAAVSSLAGFALSLCFTRIPTVPAVVVCLLVFAGLAVAIIRSDLFTGLRVPPAPYAK